MDLPNTGDHLRRDLSRFRELRPYGRLPRELGARAVEYAQARQRRGASPKEIAAELGVHLATAKKWAEASVGNDDPMESPETSVPWIPLVVRPEPTTTTNLEITFPDGTRVATSAVSTAHLAELLETLRRPR